jgi:hypothetical protein
MHAETLRRSRPLLSRGLPQRSVSTAPDRQVLGFAAWERPLTFPLCVPSWPRPMSRSVSETLPNDTSKCSAGPLNIVNAKRDTLVVAEIKLGEVAFQMLFADMVVRRASGSKSSPLRCWCEHRRERIPSRND